MARACFQGGIQDARTASIQDQVAGVTGTGHQDQLKKLNRRHNQNCYKIKKAMFPMKDSLSYSILNTRKSFFYIAVNQ